MKLKSFIVLLTIISCSMNNNDEIKNSKFYITEKEIFEGVVEVKLKRVIDSMTVSTSLIDSLGLLTMIFIYDNDFDSGEGLTFHENGMLKSKKQNSNYKHHGLAYYFYESGVIEGYRKFDKGKVVGLANDYHDTTGRLKAVLFYNDKGQLYYRQTFDQEGNVVDVEGSR